jgi:hypothetical protein
MEGEDQDYLNIRYEKQFTDFLKKDGNLLLIHSLRENPVLL